MTATAINHGDHTGRRVRTSEHALRIALKVAKDEGMVVDKMCVSGGQIVIHFGGVEPETAPANNGGLKEW